MIVSIIGANGLIGSLLLEQLINDNRIGKIYIVHYRVLLFDHPKIEFVQCNFDDLLDLSLAEKVSIAYCCIGTTRKKTPNMRAYYQIDVTFPVHFAKWFIKQGGTHFSVVSAVSANVNASSFYSRFKGELEVQLDALEIPKLSVMRPSLLLGNRKEKRLAERIGTFFVPLFDLFLVGNLKKYRPINVEKVASKMLEVSFLQKGEVIRYQWMDFTYF